MANFAFNFKIRNSLACVYCSMLIVCLLTALQGKLIITPTDVNVTGGESVRLKCSTDSRKPVNWQFGKQVDRMRDVYISGEGLVAFYKNLKRYSVEEDSVLGQWDLLIMNTTFDDAGYYICSEPTGKDDPPHARLLVSGIESLTTFCRKDFVIAVVDTKTELEFSDCKAPFYISHMPFGETYSKSVFDREKLINGYADGRFSVQKPNGVCLLSIQNTSRLDAGTFTCTDQSGSGEKHAVELVTLVRLPKCSSNYTNTSLRADPGSRVVEARCEANFIGKCVPLFSWWHQNGGSDGYYMIDPVPKSTQQSDDAVYSTIIINSSSNERSKVICFIWEPLLQSNSSIQCSLTLENAVEGRLVEVPENQTVNPGADVVFRCRTSNKESVDWRLQRQGKSEVNVFIGRTGGGGDMSNRYAHEKRIGVEMDITEGQYDLVIRNITAPDEGVYSCSDISDPSIAGVASLIIRSGGGPRSEALRTETCRYNAAAFEGEELTLSFQAPKTSSFQLEHQSLSKAYPLHVFRDGRIVNDYYVLSERFNVNSSTGAWNLVIRNVQMEDAGTYIFSEENGLGEQQHRELIVIRKRDQQNTIECEKNCTVFYSGHCPPSLEWRLFANEADINPMVLMSSRKIVHNNIAASVILDETTEDLEQSRAVCSVIIDSEDRTSDLKIQDCNFSPQRLPYSQLEEPASKVALITSLTVSLVFIALMAVAVAVSVYIKREKLRRIAETYRDQSLEDPLGFLWGLIVRWKTTKETPSITESPQRTKDVLLEMTSTPIGKPDAGECSSLRKRTPGTESAKKTTMAKKNTARNSSLRKNLNNEMKHLQ